MFNIERELELVDGGMGRYVFGRITSVTDDVIQVTVRRDGIDYDNHSFSRATGVLIGHEHQDSGLWRLREKSEMKPVSHFFLYTGIRDWAKDQWVKIEAEDHPDGATAAARMKEHNEKAGASDSPFRFIVKKEVELSPIRDYAKWAEERFETGEWQRLPWADEPWASSIAYHYAHISKVDDCKVAFWETEANAQSDYVSTMAPGRYLKQFFPHLSDTEIRDWAVKVDVCSDLKFVTDPEEIYGIYKIGPDSCMKYADGSNNWAGPDRKNPTRVYGAGDLALAYLERRGRIIARALCWPEKKVVGRIYGDIERMTAAFEAEGWQFDCRNHNLDGRGEGLLSGAKLLKIRVGSDYMMPYLDFGYGVDMEDEYFTLQKNGNYFPRNTNGLLGIYDDEDEDDDDVMCDHCEDYVSEDDTRTVGNVLWCRSCAADDASRCVVCDELHANDDLTFTATGDGYCSRHDGVVSSCDYCSERYHTDDLLSVTDARNEEPASEACEYCYHHDTGIVTDWRGNRVDAATVTQCDSCEEYYASNLDECPTETCVEARAEEEMEPA